MPFFCKSHKYNNGSQFQKFFRLQRDSRSNLPMRVRLSTCNAQAGKQTGKAGILSTRIKNESRTWRDVPPDATKASLQDIIASPTLSPSPNSLCRHHSKRSLGIATTLFLFSWLVSETTIFVDSLLEGFCKVIRSSSVMKPIKQILPFVDLCISTKFPKVGF